MPFMNCPPGAGLWTRDGSSYQDDGTGRIWVEMAHVTEAVAAGWRLVTDQPVIDADPGDVHIEPDESPQSTTSEEVGYSGGVDVPITSEVTAEESPSSRRSTRSKP